LLEKFVERPRRRLTILIAIQVHSPVMSKKSGDLVLPIINLVKVMMVNDVTWGFPTQSFPHAKTYVGLHVKCPLLSDFNKKLECINKF
jgi:hypothetical protein